jgi:hypothetical protein
LNEEHDCSNSIDGVWQGDRTRRAIARAAIALDADDPADRPLIIACPDLLAAFVAWQVVRGYRPLPAISPPPRRVPNESYRVSRAHPSDWDGAMHGGGSSGEIPFVHVSEQQELAGDALRWQLEDEVADGDADYGWSCCVCGSATRRVQRHRKWGVVCPPCARFLFRRTYDFDNIRISDAEPPSDITWDFDFDYVPQRLNSPPWQPGQRHR